MTIDDSGDFIRAAISSECADNLLQYLTVVSDISMGVGDYIWLPFTLGHMTLPLESISYGALREVKVCRLIVFSCAVPTAFAWEKAGEKLIMISDDLIDLLVFQGFHCMLMNTGPARKPINELHDPHELYNVLESMYYNIVLFRTKGLVSKYPISEINSLWPDKGIFATYMASSNLSFFLLHELGHLASGHCKSNSVTGGLSPPCFFVDEQFKEIFSQEYSADLYALRNGGELIAAWGALFQDFAILEGLHGYPTDEKHPCSINRLQAIFDQIECGAVASHVKDAWLSNFMDAGRFYDDVAKRHASHATYPKSGLKYGPPTVNKETLDQTDIEDTLVSRYLDAANRIRNIA